MTRRLLAIAFSFTALLAVTAPAMASAPNVVVTEAYAYVPGDVDDPGVPLRIHQGDTLTLLNLDPLGAHDVTSYDVDADGHSVFETPNAVNFDQFAAVNGVEALAPGEYPFFCGVHGPVMEGVLVVDPPLA